MKKRRYFTFAIPFCICIAVIFCVISYFNTQNNGKLKKEAKQISSQTTESSEPSATESSDNNSDNSDDSAVKKELKKAINNIEQDISEIQNYDEEKTVLEKFIKSLVDSLTVTEPKDDTLSIMKNNLKKIMNDDCCNKVINNDFVDWTEKASYTYATKTYADLDTDNPKAFYKTVVENEEGTDFRYFDVTFAKDGNSYVIADVNITA